MIGLVLFMLYVLVLAALAVPPTWLSRIVPHGGKDKGKRRERGGYVWEATEADTETSSLESSEGALVAARLAHVLDRAGYREEMCRVARQDDARRTVRVPLTHER